RSPMPSWEAITVVVLAGITLSASPGPSMFYVLSRSLAQGRAAGFASLLGLAVGGVLLAIISALGLATLFIYSATAYGLIRGLGGCYLVYLALRMVVPALGGSRGDEACEARPPARAALGSIFGQGVVVELLNPGLSG